MQREITEAARGWCVGGKLTVHSLHFGLVPSQRLLRDLQTSHYRLWSVIQMQKRCKWVWQRSDVTYGNGCPPPRIVKTGVRISSFQRVNAVVAALVLHGNGLQAIL